MMHTVSFIVILVTINLMDLPFSVLCDDNSDDSHSFSDRIVALQSETRYLCTQIEQKSLVTTKRFTKLMQDVHIHCPDIKALDIPLLNVENMAYKYSSFVAQQLGNCQELSKMLTKGLENGDLVIYYLKEGNYSLVTGIIDKWHESFTKFHATFYLTDTPLTIMLKNKKIFYYENWLKDKIQSFFKWTLLITSSVALSWILVWIGSIFGLVTVFSQFLTAFLSKQPSIQPDLPQRENINVTSDENGLRHRKQSSTSEITRSIETVPTTPTSPRIHTILILLLAVLFIVGIYVFSPSTISSSKSMRRNWYPDATTTLETMEVDRDNLQSNLLYQISSIEELQNHARMYHDKSVQAIVDEFIHQLGEGVRQISKELSNVYILSEQMPSLLRRASNRIKTEATRIGKLPQVEELLADLSQSAGRYEGVQRALQTSVIHQQKVLPILKEQTQSMQALVRDDRLIEIRRVIDQHQDALFDIDGTIYKVEIQLTNFIQIISDEHIDGMKKTIQTLSEDSVQEQIKVMITGALGTTASTVVGAVAMKTGYAMITITGAVVAGPALGAAGVLGGIGLVAFGSHWALDKFDQYKGLSNYQKELAVLETHRMNLQVAMGKVQEGITAQQTALQSSQSSLRKISDHCGRLSKIPGFTLNRIQRNAIDDELMNAVTEYNRMMAVYSLFTESIHKNNEALPAA